MMEGNSGGPLEKSWTTGNLSLYEATESTTGRKRDSSSSSHLLKKEEGIEQLKRGQSSMEEDNVGLVSLNFGSTYSLDLESFGNRKSSRTSDLDRMLVEVTESAEHLPSGKQTRKDLYKRSPSVDKLRKSKTAPVKKRESRERVLKSHASDSSRERRSALEALFNADGDFKRRASSFSSAGSRRSATADAVEGVEQVEWGTRKTSSASSNAAPIPPCLFHTVRETERELKYDWSTPRKAYGRSVSHGFKTAYRQYGTNTYGTLQQLQEKTERPGEYSSSSGPNRVDVIYTRSTSEPESKQKISGNKRRSIALSRGATLNNRTSMRLRAISMNFLQENFAATSLRQSTGSRGTQRDSLRSNISEFSIPEDGNEESYRHERVKGLSRASASSGGRHSSSMCWSAFGFDEKDENEYLLEHATLPALLAHLVQLSLLSSVGPENIDSVNQEIGAFLLLWDSFASASDMVSALVELFLSNQSGECVGVAIPPASIRRSVKSVNPNIARIATASKLRRRLTSHSSTENSNDSACDSIPEGVASDASSPNLRGSFATKTMAKRKRRSNLRERRSSGLSSIDSNVPNEPIQVIATDKNAMFQTLSLMLAWAESLKDTTRELSQMSPEEQHLAKEYSRLGKIGLGGLGDFAEDALIALSREREHFSRMTYSTCIDDSAVGTRSRRTSTSSSLGRRRSSSAAAVAAAAAASAVRRDKSVYRVLPIDDLSGTIAKRRVVELETFLSGEYAADVHTSASSGWLTIANIADGVRMSESEIQQMEGLLRNLLDVCVGTKRRYRVDADIRREKRERRTSTVDTMNPLSFMDSFDGTLGGSFAEGELGDLLDGGVGDDDEDDDEDDELADARFLSRKELLRIELLRALGDDIAFHDVQNRGFFDLFWRLVEYEEAVASSETFTLMQIAPREVASQLTVLMHNYGFQQLSLVALSSPQRRKSNLAAQIMMRFFEVCSIWPLAVIFGEKKDSVSKRISMLGFFVDVCTCLRELRNYHALFAIVGGLTSPCIEWLWRRAHRRDVNRFEPLKRVIGASNNYRVYRADLSKSVGMPQIPYIGMCTRLLMLLDESFSAFHAENSALINFERCRKVRRVVTDYLSAQNIEYKIAAKPGIQRCIINALAACDIQKEVATALSKVAYKEYKSSIKERTFHKVRLGLRKLVV